MSDHAHHLVEEHIDTVVADSISVDFCEHGNGAVSLWIAGDKRPFAVAYIGPDAVLDLAELFARNLKVQGHA